MPINTELFSHRLRKRAMVLGEKKILIARLTGAEQEKDITSPINCEGYGRIRHFHLVKHKDWSSNPLPIVPAAKALGYNPEKALRAQVFQNSACNWRCWYCFVDFNRLSADLRYSKFFTADELIDMYLRLENRPEVIDLSGGQPDLVPEWVLWTMEVLQDRGLANEVFLWSDDNLSNKYFWDYLTPKQQKFMAKYSNYSRVACFKGYDENSFSFNTLAEPELFNQQFEIFERLLVHGFDMYAYVTFTAIPNKDLNDSMEIFIDKLQKIHPNLPLRTIPLKIEAFTPTLKRIQSKHNDAMKFQYQVHAVWQEKLHQRFSQRELSSSISDIPMRL